MKTVIVPSTWIAMTPQQFIAKWQRVSLSERSACQQPFLDLCDLLGQPKPAAADPDGTWYTFERGVHKTAGGQGWADVWMRDHFGWESKGRVVMLCQEVSRMGNPAFRLDSPSTELYVGDCRDILNALPERSVDLIFADPPFNWDVPYGEWNDARPRQEYIAFTHEWLDACVRVLNDSGSFWVNIPDDTAAEIVVHLKQRGLLMINWCIWHFRFGQHRVGNFIVSKVHALYFARQRENRVWNPDAVLEPSDRAAVYDDPRTRKTRQPGLRVPLDVWYGPNWGRIQGNNRERRRNHQNQIPEVYLERVIRACSNEGQLVLDPFLGSGTTCTVARALGRRSIGIEYSIRSAASAFERIQAGPVRLSTTPESTLS